MLERIYRDAVVLCSILYLLVNSGRLLVFCLFFFWNLGFCDQVGGGLGIDSTSVVMFMARNLTFAMTALKRPLEDIIKITHNGMKYYI